MIVVGITGYARVGKDTVANHLVDIGGFTRLAFADPLRKIVRVMDPVLVVREDIDIYDDDLAHSEHRLSDYLKLGVSDAELKAHTDYREYLKRLGNGAREHVSADVWITAAETSLWRAAAQGKSRFVLSDCRFPNEAAWIRDFGGYVWRIVREGYGPESDFELASDAIEADFTFGAPDVPSLQAVTAQILSRTFDIHSGSS